MVSCEQVFPGFVHGECVRARCQFFSLQQKPYFEESFAQRLRRRMARSSGTAPPSSISVQAIGLFKDRISFPVIAELRGLACVASDQHSLCVNRGASSEGINRSTSASLSTVDKVCGRLSSVSSHFCHSVLAYFYEFSLDVMVPTKIMSDTASEDVVSPRPRTDTRDSCER